MILRLKRQIGLMVCCMLLFAFITPVSYTYADGTSEVISINSSVKVTLHNKQIIKQDNGKVALFTLRIDNQSNEVVPLIDYWARIKSGASSYVTKLVPVDEGRSVVMPKNELYLSFYAVVGQSETLDKLKLEFIKWDFSVSNYERILGTLSTSKITSQKYQTTATTTYGQYYLNSKVTSYTMIEEADYNRLNFKLYVANMNSKKVALSALQFMLETDDGTVYDTDSILSTLELKGRENKYVNVSVYVPKQKSLKGSKLKLMSLEEKADLPIMTYELPDLTETKPVKNDTFKALSVNETTLHVKNGKSEVTTENKRVILSSVITIINKSTAPLELPDFTYYVKTSEGYMYPLAHESEKKIKLLPNMEQEIEVTGQVPSSDVLKNGQLVIFLKVDDQEQLIQNFNLTVSATEEPIETGVNEASYDGNLISFSSMNRIPKGDKDIIVTEFTIKNTSSKAKSKLDLKGQFILDGVKLDAENTSIYNLNPNYTVQPKDQYRVLAYFEIPYTQSFNELKFEMQDDEKKIQTFDVKDMTSTKLLAANQKYQVATVGKRADVLYNQSKIYEGSKDNLFVAEFVLTNTETRSVVPSNLSGYIQNKKGEILNLDFEKVEERVLPGGKVSLLGSVVIPKTFDSKNVEIHIGEQLVIEENTVMINPVYTNHVDVKKVLTSISEPMQIKDLEFKINMVQVDWFSSDNYTFDGIQMYYEYSLNASEQESTQLGDRQIMIEYQDLQVPTIKFSKTYTLGKQEGDNDLKIGNRGSDTIVKTDSSVLFSDLVNYQINVYEVYKGYKTLIASETFN